MVRAGTYVYNHSHLLDCLILVFNAEEDSSLQVSKGLN